jgi:formate dehydrogenase major subunit
MSLQMSRRQFLKGSVGGAGVGGLVLFGFDGEAAAREAHELKIQNAVETRSVCPYCAVGCSMIAYTIGGKAANTTPTLIHIEGDPDSPINSGTLCPKGASTLQLAVNQNRAEFPMYRAPGAADWTRISWDDAMEKLTRWVKSARDNHFTLKDSQGFTVNRQTGFAFLGGATISNEEGYFTAKLMRALGTVYIEQQARV